MGRVPAEKRSAASDGLRSVTPLEGGILALLARGGELSGWDLQKQAGTSVAYFWPTGRSQIYAALPRLEKLGLVQGRDVPQVGKPDKRVFRLTAHGRDALRSWLDEPDVRPPRDIFLLKLFFSAHGDRSAVRQRIVERREAARRLREELDEMSDSPDLDDFFHGLTRSFGRSWACCLVDWCDDALAALAALDHERSER